MNRISQSHRKTMTSYRGIFISKTQLYISATHTENTRNRFVCSHCHHRPVEFIPIISLLRFSYIMWRHLSWEILNRNIYENILLWDFLRFFSILNIGKNKPTDFNLCIRKVFPNTQLFSERVTQIMKISLKPQVISSMRKQRKRVFGSHLRCQRVLYTLWFSWFLLIEPLSNFIFLPFVPSISIPILFCIQL